VTFPEYDWGTRWTSQIVNWCAPEVVWHSSNIHRSLWNWINFKLILVHPVACFQISITVNLVVKAKFSVMGSSKKVSKKLEITAKTGNSYISESMKDTIDFPTANLGFTTTESSKKVSASDCNSSRQPEMAIWPPKLEILIYLELWQTASKFQWHIKDFWPWPARYKLFQETAIVTDNWKWHCGYQNQKYFYIWNYDIHNQHSKVKSGGFRPCWAKIAVPGWL